MTNEEKNFRAVLAEPGFTMTAAFCVVASPIPSVGLADGILFMQGGDDAIISYLLQAAYREPRMKRILKKVGKIL